MSDPVNSPAHYIGRGLEAIEVIEDWGLGFHLGNAFKYIVRAPNKGRWTEDMQKAIWYLERARRDVMINRLAIEGPRRIEPGDVLEAFGIAGARAIAIDAISQAAYFCATPAQARAIERRLERAIDGILQDNAEVLANGA
ncbi:MAG: DUF3310 domain-containing protein [Hyphomicrobium sp.]